MQRLQETMPDLDLLPCGFITADKDRNVLSCNRYALDLLSMESDESIVGAKIEALFSFATRIFMDSYTYPILLNEGEAKEVQLSLKSNTTESVPVVANIRMNQDKTTFWTFMGCVNRDKLYNELLNARDTLQSQALQLTQLNDRMLERQADMQVFCQSLSHDFTGPLRRIHQMIDFALEDFQEKKLMSRRLTNCLTVRKIMRIHS